MLKGTLNRILYQKNDFIVGILGEKKVCGRLPGARTGLQLTLYGRTENHKRYGEQYVFNSYKIHEDNPYHYLASGLIRHVGPATAKELIKKLSVSSGERMIVLAFRSPYELSEYPLVSTYLCTYSSRPCSAQAAAQAVVMKKSLTGKAPISVL
jgi:hypothetical protein